MYLSKVAIRNYLSIRYLSLELSKGKNVIVGKNNSGKSNIIRAINLVLGEKNPKYAEISEKDFFSKEGESEKFFWVLCKLEGKEIDKDILGKCNGFSVGVVTKPVFVNSNNEIDLRLENIFFDPRDGEFEDKKYIKSEKDKIDLFLSQEFIYIAYYAHWSEEENEYIKEIRLILRKKLDNLFSDKKIEWQVAWGLPPQIREALLTSAVVGAFRDTQNQLRINNYSWYGRLIKQLWNKEKTSTIDGISAEESMREHFKGIQTVADGVFLKISDDIHQKLDLSFGDTKISFQFLGESNSDIHKNVQIYVDDGFKSLLYEKGAGIQSSVVISLFSHYCYSFHKNTSLLVVEEPELFLHPQARRALSEKLEDFLFIKGEKENQLILTTHSSEFISAGKNLSGITVVSKFDGETSAKYYDLRGVDTKELQTLLKNENSEMFFADKVILVEGAEKHLIPYIADKMSEEKGVLDKKNISVIRAGSKYDLVKYYNILNKCQIDSYILADRDYFFDGLKIFLESIAWPERNELLKFATEVYKNSVVGYKKMSDVENKTIKESFDAKKLCEALEFLEEEINEENINSLLNIWKYIKPKVKKRDVESYMIENNFYDIFKKYCDALWEKNLYILRKGELEDYLTSEGRRVEGSKEAKVINIIRGSKDLNYYFDTCEIEFFLSKIIFD